MKLPPVHPGLTLADEMSCFGLSGNALALKLGVPANRVTEIIRGKRGISPDMALRLACCFGTHAVFWMNLQVQYELAVAERKHGARIRREVLVASGATEGV